MQDLDDVVTRLSEFNRFYTILQGFFTPRFLGTEYSVAELRILYEVSAAPGCTARDLTQTLRLDKGYISHRLKTFEEAGLLTRLPSPQDKRRQTLHLTQDGSDLLARLVTSNNNRLAAILGHLTPDQCRELSQAMDTMTRLLSPPQPDTPTTQEETTP